MAELKNVCVYCGSSSGNNPRYLEAARMLGTALAREKIRLVYGGGGIGMMGEVARAAESEGGKVLGIIPHFLVAREHAEQGAREIVVVSDMHERKRMMFERADAFVALPGGIGTLEELVEQLAWLQLGRHKKPVLLANILGYWSPLIELLKHLGTEGYLYNGPNYLVAERIEDVLPKLRAALRHVSETELHGKAAKAVVEGI
ncbi:MAG TPA: TIGR00730 family Rossman fold protein [Xanthobacteraceae bacterium]|nr:TIGR00730 family Rossman fold protein [Xanthobacteraceae bacterium]